MAPRQRSVSTDFLSRARKQLEAHGRVALGGMNSVGAAARARGGGGLSVLTNAGGEGGESSGAAQLLVLSVTGDSIASGGDYVEFDSILDQYGFDGVVQPSGGYWVHPIGGVYVVTYEHIWDSYEGGGTIDLEIDGVVSAATTLATGSSGAMGRGTLSYLAEAGSVGRIKVTQSSGSAQTCSGTAWISLPDPTGEPPSSSEEAEEPPPPLEMVSVGDGDLGTMTLTHGVPTSTKVGDLLMLSLSGYSNEGAQGGDGSITPDPAWTNLETLDNSRKTLRLYYKVADADDEAGTSSYDWTYTAAGTYGRIVCDVIPQAHGTTLSAAVSDSATSSNSSTTSLSVAAPEGSWLYAAVMAKTGRTNDTGDPMVTVTNADATQLSSYTTWPNEGYHRHYSLPADSSPVTAEMGAAEDSFGALIVVGVS